MAGLAQLFHSCLSQSEGGRVPGIVTGWLCPSGRVGDPSGDPSRTQRSQHLSRFMPSLWFPEGDSQCCWCLQDAVGDTWKIVSMSVSKHIYAVRQTHNVKKLRCPPTHEWLNNIQCNVIQPQKRNEALTQATTRMALENMMLNEGNQTQMATYYITSFISNVHNRQINRDGK